MADERDDLPQPGDDPDAEARDSDRGDPTSGPGKVTVDEPTQSALDPGGEAEEWREAGADAGDQDIRNVGRGASADGAAGENDADAASG